MAETITLKAIAERLAGIEGRLARLPSVELIQKQQKAILEEMTAMRADLSGMREEMLVLTTVVVRQGRSAPEQLISDLRLHVKIDGVAERVRKLEDEGRATE